MCNFITTNSQLTFSLRKPYYVVICQSLELEYEMLLVNFAIPQNKFLIREQIFTRGNLPFNMQQIIRFSFCNFWIGHSIEFICQVLITSTLQRNAIPLKCWNILQWTCPKTFFLFYSNHSLKRLFSNYSICFILLNDLFDLYVLCYYRIEEQLDDIT
jgi:hypothetical protein